MPSALPILLIIAAAHAAIAAGTEPAPDAARGRLEVTITGFESDAGVAHVSLFDSKELWLEEGRAIIDTEAPITHARAIWTVELPHGDYGLVVYHDRDHDGEIERNFLGVPRERYGFSNNVRPTVKKPSWESARVTLDGERLEIEIEVQ